MKNLFIIIFLLFSYSLLSQTTKITLDSAQHYYYNGQYLLSHTEYYEYNDKAALTKEYRRRANDTSALNFHNIKAYTYSRGLNDSIFELDMRYTGAVVENYTVNTYNKDSLLIKTEIFYVSADSVFYTQKTEWEYDDANRIIKEINGETSRFCWTYNQDGLLIRLQLQGKINGVWESSIYNTYTYNDKKLLIQYQSFLRDSVQANEDKYYYDNQDREILHTYHRMLSWNELKYKDSTVYNNQNQKVEFYYTGWENDTWAHPYLRIVYIYDGNGNQIEEIEQRWEDADSQWVHSNKEVTLYNSDNQLTHYYWQRWWDKDVGDWYGGFVETYFYNEDGKLSEKFFNEWVDSLNDFTQDAGKTLYYYTEREITPFNLPSIKENCPFVNPYSIGTPIYCENWEINQNYKLQVFSIDGKLVYDTQFYGIEGFRVNKNLQKGYYIFVVFEEGKILQSQKILVY